MVLLAVITACFIVQIVLAAPPVAAVIGGLEPTTDIASNPKMLYIAIGILGDRDAAQSLPAFLDRADPRKGIAAAIVR